MLDLYVYKSSLKEAQAAIWNTIAHQQLYSLLYCMATMGN